jgi:DNA-directed RNA polymerase sigma subunit (sigma70/sigma32)
MNEGRVRELLSELNPKDWKNLAALRLLGDLFVVSLDGPVHRGGQWGDGKDLLTFGDIVPDTSQLDPCRKAEIGVFHRRLRKLLDHLEKEQRGACNVHRDIRIFRDYTGVLNNSDPLSVTEIARRYELSNKGIDKVLVKLRKLSPEYKEIWDVIDRYREEWRRDHGRRNQQRNPPPYGRTVV